MVNWVKQVRAYEVHKEPAFSVISTGFRLNADFGVKIKDAKCCEIYVSDTGREIAFRFLQRQDPEAFTVGTDGGSKRGVKTHNGRFIACKSVIDNNDSLRSMLKQPAKHRRVIVRESDGLWIGALVPAFARNTRDNPPHNGALGVYRYVSEGDVVYIGQGVLKQRLSSPDRQAWVFDLVEYFLVDSKEEAVAMEKLYLDDYISRYGKLPLYNRVSGLSHV